MTDVVPRLARARANALGASGEGSGGHRRHRGRVVGGVILLVVSGWVAAAVFTSVGGREEVVALARPVGAFEELSREDLRVVRVAADGEVPLVPAEELGALVGRVAGVDLAEGALLHGDQLLGAGERPVGAGEGVVGALLGPGDAPGSLAPGSRVEVVVAPGSMDEPVSTLAGWVLEVDEGVEGPGSAGRRVDLVVPVASVAGVAAAAADGRVSVGVVGGG